MPGRKRIILWAFYEQGNSGACGLSEREPQTFFVIFNIIEVKNSEAYSFGVFHTIFYLVNSNIISLLRFTNFVIAGGMGGMDPNMFAADQTLTLNANNALVKYLFEHKDSEHSGMFAEQLYDLLHHRILRHL